MSYKITHEDDHLFHIKHPDGSTFAVAKKAIGPKLSQKIQHLYGGGEVDDVTAGIDDMPDAVSPSEDPALEAPTALREPASDLGLVPNYTAPAQPQAPEGWHAPMAAAEPQNFGEQAEGHLSAQQNQDPYAGMPALQAVNNALKQSSAGRDQFSKDVASAYGEFNKTAGAAATLETQHREALDKEQADLQQKLLDGRVDPKRFFNNMGTGNKITAAIALILGGIGSGLTHQPNAALGIMNKAVDDDINAQKDELGKTKNLLSINMDKYKNLQTAEAATRLQMNTMLQTKLQTASAKATNSQSQAAIQMNQAALQQQAEATKGALAAKIAQAQSLGYGSGEGGIPVKQEPASLLLDPEYRKNRVVFNGKAYQANDKEAAGKVRDVETLAGPVMTAVKELSELSKDPSTRFAGSSANLRAHALMGDLAVKLPLLSGATIGAKRINEAEIEHQMERLQNPTRMDQALGDSKTKQFFKSLEQDVESVREQHVIGYKGMGAVKSFQPASGKLPLNK